MPATTIEAVMQMRRGLENDLDIEQLRVGEWALSTDKKWVRICYAQGKVIKIASQEAMDATLAEIQEIEDQIVIMKNAAAASALSASGSATTATTKAGDAEAWAVGKRDGTDVPSTDPAYHNNAKYWSEQAQHATQLSGLTDVEITSPANNQTLKYDSALQKWENADEANADVKSATNSFSTVNGGLLDELSIKMNPVQDLHGYTKPWAGGAGKNVLPLTVDNIKSLNGGSSAWTNNKRTIEGVEFEILVDADNNVIGIKADRKSSSANRAFLSLAYQDFSFLTASTSYTLNGCPSGGSNTSYALVYQAVTGTTYWDEGNGTTFTFTGTVTDATLVRLVIRSSYSPSNMVFKPMIRLASIADPTFEPFSNICPISGHTEAKSKINNTVYTTSLGGTEYGGELDMVSGEGKSIYGRVDLGSLTYTKDASGAYYVNLTAAKSGLIDMLCECYPYDKSIDFSFVNYASLPDHQIFRHTGATYIYIKDTNYATASDLKTALNGMYLYFETPTPTTLTLTGQSITAEVGENNVSAPLEGQNIKTNGIEYRDLFVWDDVTDEIKDSEKSVFKSLGFKNLLPNAGKSTYTAGSLTFTKNPDGSVLVNGTNDTGNTVNYFFNIENSVSGAPCFSTLEEGTYILSGCPSGGGPSNWSYALQLFYDNNTANAYGSDFEEKFDFGTGMTAVVNSSNNSNVGCRILVADGKTLNNLLFKPMLRLAEDKDSTYQPYTKTNKELTESVAFSKADITTSFTKDTTRTNSVRKQGKVVTLDLNLTGVTITTGNEIALIPSEYRISDNSFVSAISISGQPGFCEIRQNGKIVASSDISDKSVRLHTSWIME